MIVNWRTDGLWLCDVLRPRVVGLFVSADFWCVLAVTRPLNRQLTISNQQNKKFMSEIKLTDTNFDQEVLKSEIPVFVDFFAPWCGPCQAASLVVEELAKEYEGKIKICELDVDQNPVSAQKFGVMSIPTVITFKGGQEVKRQAGFPGKEGYVKLLEEVLGK